MSYRLLLLWLLTVVHNPAYPTPNDTMVLQHQLLISISPEKGKVSVTDTLTLPAPVSTLTIELNSSLELTGANSEQFKPIEQRGSGTLRVTRYRLDFTQPTRSIPIQYKGVISNPMKETTAAIRGGRPFTLGTISPSGVFLSGISYWYPTIQGARHKVSLQTELPESWQAVSQGEYDSATGSWNSTTPQDEIYLIAGAFNRYTQVDSVAQIEAYLLSEDQPLASRYLDSAAHWLSFYQQLLGPYPYKKFALVENHWQSGYGMPSFTLLGSRVIRLPFILYSSYPHEILHNWWGNGVYVDYSQGNWSEGLTSYLADHLIQEQRGLGMVYRRKALIGYANQVSPEDDFPIKDFTGHSGHHSQAIGYGKTMMFFHMLRRELGDKLFIDGLRHFYNQELFKSASFQSLQSSFELVSKQSLDQFFDQWLERTGAPRLALENAEVEQNRGRYLLTATIVQIQKMSPYHLQIPYLVQFEDGTIVTLTDSMTGRRLSIQRSFNKKPMRLAIDPSFDLFRQLENSEIPNSLSQLFVSKKLLIILPTNAPKDLVQAYRTIAEGWAQGARNITIRDDSDITTLPEHDIFIFGRANRFKELFADKIQQQALNGGPSSFALVQAHGRSKQLRAGHLVLENSVAAAGMARKLPHYGKYSYVQFSGATPSIITKGEWPVFSRSLQKNLTPRLSEHLPLLTIPSRKSLMPLKYSP